MKGWNLPNINGLNFGMYSLQMALSCRNMSYWSHWNVVGVLSSSSSSFFSRRYNPWCVLACFTISFHNLLSLHFSLQFLTFTFFKSSSTWSSHLILRLPTGLDEHCSHSVNFLTVLVVSILITCAAQRNLHCDFITLTIFCLIRFPNYSVIDSPYRFQISADSLDTKFPRRVNLFCDRPS